MRRWCLLVLMISDIAAAAPKRITLSARQESLHNVANTLSSVGGCRIMAFGSATVDLDVTNATLWQVLAKLEIDHGIATQFRGTTISLEPTSTKSIQGFGLDELSWTKHWRPVGASAIALLPGPGAD